MILCCLNSLQLVSELAWMTFELQFLSYFFFSFSSYGSHFFFFGFLFIWSCFLVLKPDWGWRLVENIVWSKTHNFFFYDFWSSFDGISKIRAYFGSFYYAFFCAFLGLDWRIDIWGWKFKCFCQKMHKILGGIFFSSPELGRVQLEKKINKSLPMSLKKENNFFFLVALVLLGWLCIC